jgi:hypothetical protein
MNKGIVKNAAFYVTIPKSAGNGGFNGVSIGMNMSYMM